MAPPSLDKAVENPKSATNLTQVPAKNQITTASIDMSAKSAIKPAMDRKIVRKGASEVYGLQPKYLRHNLWQEGSAPSPTTAEWSEHACPLPRPPLSEVFHPVAAKTTADNPDLFQIVTPIKVDVFESLLKDHPNPAFVQSICAGLREGFWPWADTRNGIFPSSHDESWPTPSDEKQAAFIRAQCLKECKKGRFLDSFGSELLPGMFLMPVHAVPKPDSSDLCLVMDHSAGSFSLNSMIDHSQVTVKWLVATSDQKDVNFKIIQSLLSTKSQSILAHNL